MTLKLDESIPEERNYLAPFKKRLHRNTEYILEALEIDGEMI